MAELRARVEAQRAALIDLNRQLLLVSLLLALKILCDGFIAWLNLAGS